jgi:Putative zinc-finger
MTVDIGHDRCSELLLPYERGELGAPEADAVERHLRSCDRCAAERAGFLVLVEAPGDPMTPSERNRLHAALDEEMHRRAEQTAPVRSAHHGRTLWGRLSSWGGGALVGAAAALVLVVGALVFGPNLAGGGGDEEGGGQAVGVGEPAQGPEPVFAVAKASAAPEAVPGAAQAQETAGDATGGGDTRRKGRPATMREFGAFAATSKPFTSFAAAYRAEDVPALRDRYLQDLSRAAVDALQTIPLERSPAAIVRQCAELAIEQSATPLLPAYATYTPVNGVESLVIGFVSSEGSSRLVDRYTILAWPGADCAASPSFVSGDIAPGD